MIRWWLLLTVAGVAVSACSSGQASLAHSSSRTNATPAPGAGPGIHSSASGNRDITAAGCMGESGILPRVTHPGLGINVSAGPPAAPRDLAADAVSPGAVLTAFKAQPDASLVGSALRTERPAIMLRTITELHPTARGVRPHVPYPGWVVIYHHVRLVSYGLHSFSKNFRGTFVAIMDAATGHWANFFDQGRP